MPGQELNNTSIPASEWSAAILPLLDGGHTLKIPLNGLSMYPLIVGGRDEVVLSSASDKTLKRGDIVLYTRENGLHILHRIHHIKDGSYYYMLGDAQTWIEGPIKKENVLAVAVSVVRKGKTISCSRIDYRIYSSLWLLARPMRPQLMRAAPKIAGFLRRFLRHK